MKKFYLCAMLLLMAATTQAQNQMSAKAEKYMLTIKYLYAADSSDAHPEYTAKLEENELYSVVSPEVAGYKPDRDTVKGTMPAHDITETVYYSIKSYTVTVSANPADGGTVTGGGPYNHGDTCTVIATANEGYAFVNWTKNDSIVSTEAEYRFLVTEDCTFVANFTATLPPTYTITVSANPSNGGTVTGGGTYNQGQSCTVTATPASGYTFLRWTENGSQVSTNASYTFNVTENRALVASFTATPPPTYTITVSANPSNGGTVTGGGTYNQGQSCTVTATANTGYTFTNWTENGNVVSSEQSYTFTVAANRNLVANFELLMIRIAGTVEPEEAATLVGAGNYTYGDEVTLTLERNEDWAFQNWTENGEVVCETMTYTFIATENRDLVASFLYTEGIGENSIEAKIYPNPTKGDITLEGEGLNHVRIVNAFGQTVYNADIENNQVRVDISDFAKGIYVIHIGSTNGNATRKIMVE